MINWPAGGAQLADLVLEPKSFPPGWSKKVDNYGSRPSYFFFDESDRHVERYLNLPDGVDENDVVVIHDDYATDARSTVLFKLAENLAMHLPIKAPFGKLDISPKRIMGLIGEYAQIPGTDAATWIQVEQKLSYWAELLVSGSHIDPAFEVVAQYMSFLLYGKVARYSLSSIYELAYYALPKKRHGDSTRWGAELLQKAEDLSDAAYRLLRERTDLNVSGFYNATFFAVLCAGTVMELGRERGRESPYDQAQWARLSRLRQNADELIAHYLAPAFKLPALTNTRGILQRVSLEAHLRRMPPADVAREYCLHPGLIEILTGVDCEKWSDKAIHSRYLQNVGGRRELSLEGLLRREAVVISAKRDW
jgi:hypothetical protein